MNSWEDYSKGLLEHLDKILDYFGVEARQTNKLYYASCPCHMGDNRSAWNLYYSGHHPYWICRTHECNKVFGGDLFGLVRGLLSQSKGWGQKGDREASKKETLELIKKLTNLAPDNFKVEKEEIEKRKFTKNASAIIKLQKIESNITREQVRAKLVRPPEYYIKRGYSEQILDEYDVGLCLDGESQLYKRSIFPIYNSSYKLIGATGRSIYEGCKKCGAYHNQKLDCPPEELRWIYAKWRNSKGFVKENYFFNIWRSYPHIKESSTAILTESPGNVLRLEEAGIKNSLGLLGASMSDYQQHLLTSLGVSNILLTLDNDFTGKKSTDSLVERLQNLYCLRIYTPKTDLGDMKPEQLKEDILPILGRF